MMLPLPDKKTLPDKKKIESKQNGGNSGLAYGKFVDEWPDNKPAGRFKGLGGQQKSAWIGKFKGPVDVAQAKAAAKRLKALAGELDGETQDFVTTAPFVTGMGLEHPVENGFLWHHTLGVPYLPGYSIKGLVRAWAEQWLEEDKAEIGRIFGSAAEKEGVGSIIVFDGLPIGPVTLMAEVMTPHDGGWRQDDAPAPSDWLSPVPIPFLAVEPGATFCFIIAPRPGSDASRKDAETAMGWLQDALDWLGAGAKTSSGFGRFETWKIAEGKRRLQERNTIYRVGIFLRLKDGSEVELEEDVLPSHSDIKVYDDGPFTVDRSEVVEWDVKK